MIIKTYEKMPQKSYYMDLGIDGFGSWFRTNHTGPTWKFRR